MLHIVDLGDNAVSAIKTLLSEAQAGKHKSAQHALADVTLLAPILVPRKNVFCVFCARPDWLFDAVPEFLDLDADLRPSTCGCIPDSAHQISGPHRVLLNNLTVLHNHNTVRKIPRQRQVMNDEEITKAKLVL